MSSVSSVSSRSINSFQENKAEDFPTELVDAIGKERLEKFPRKNSLTNIDSGPVISRNNEGLLVISFVIEFNENARAFSSITQDSSDPKTYHYRGEEFVLPNEEEVSTGPMNSEKYAALKNVFAGTFSAFKVVGLN